MDNKFNKLAQEIKFNISPAFENIQIIKANLLEDNIFLIEFRNTELIPFNEMEKFLIALRNNFKYKTKFQFEVTSVILVEAEIKKYLDWIISSFLKINYLAKIINSKPFQIEENVCNIALTSKNAIKQFEDISPRVLEIMRKMGFEDFEIKLSYDSSEEGILDIEKEKNSKEAHSAVTVQKVEVVEEDVRRKGGYQKYSVKDLNDGFAGQVLLDVEIFDIKTKSTKTGWDILTFSVTDYEDAIYAKAFMKADKPKADLLALKPGDLVTIKGKYELDAYLKEPMIAITNITKRKVDVESREDKAKVKRVELSTRTRMSAMDGIASADQIVKAAEDWGHPAVAIVDTDTLQSFPDFYHATKDSKVKPIFGASLNTISSNGRAIYNPGTNVLLTDDYIVFDIETTGLSPIFEEIIEFGAVKISNGSIVEKKQFFIKPTKPISEFTTQLTGITDNDVESAVDQKEGVKQIFDYIKGFTSVAHNANFDITFVNEKLKMYELETLTDPVIDSMVVARIIEPAAKRFKLGNVAKRLSVNYDSATAHRADYDAEILARIWIKALNMLKEININTQTELFEFNSRELREKAFSNEVSVLAKNQEGLKELFKLTTAALTKNYARGPKLVFEDIKNNKNILMGSGGLKSRLVDRMFYGSKEQIINEISNYDYIEVQPLQNYKHIINRGVNKADIEEAIRFVVSESKKQNKLIVATGGVRYINKSEKAYHEVYIAAKGLGGARHPLYRFNEENPVYPDQHMLTTTEMVEAFAFLGDVKLVEEVVIENTNKIAEQVSRVQVIKDKLYTPKFGDSDRELEELVYKTARETYGEILPEHIEKRIKRELKPIIEYGFAVIYWISHLLVKKSLDDGYLVGSRGSVGSSLVATMSKITEVNPLEPHYICTECKHFEIFLDSELNSGFDLEAKDCPKCSIPLHRDGQNIPFETFLGFNADKVPDIDLNFSGDYQSTIHHEVKVLFGDKHAFRAGTISTVAEKTAYGYVKGWAETVGKELSRPQTEYLAKGVKGTKRTSGQHPGGIIVIPSEFDVEDFTPVNYPANDVNSEWQTTHFDFHSIHDNVLKLDLLGHDDPTALRLLEKLTGKAAVDVPMSDPKIVSLFSSPKALGIEPKDIMNESTGAMGIPEFGTEFVRGMLKNAKVESFGDLVSVSGLSHGTDVWATNAEILVRNEGKTLSEVISCRDNIMIDLLAKGIDPLVSFKIMESVRKGKGLTDEWMKILKEANVEEWYIDSLLKIKYMFPKAHAVAYVTMAWRVAWYKLYYPIEYYATYFTTRADNFDIHTIIKGKATIEATIKDWKSRKYARGENKLSNREVGLIPVLEIANEAIARGIKIGNIDMTKSLANEWVISGDTLVPPFSVIEGLGDAVAKSIVEARNEKAFVSKEDIKNRTSLNKTSIAKFEDLNILDDFSDSNQISMF